MLVAAAVCPHPPLLVPQLSGGAADEVTPLRQRCLEAVRCLADAAPDVLVLVGAATVTGRYPPGAAGTLAPYGVDVRAGGAGEAVLPLSLTVGSWLVDRAGVDLPRIVFGVSPGTPTPVCADIGAQLAAAAERVALLALGDGSARLDERSPGRVDPRAAGYDAGVATALAAADVKALLALDPALDAPLAVSGRAAWQVLAGASRDARLSGASPPVSTPAARLPCWRAALLAYDAPYGVGYFVATWRRA